MSLLKLLRISQQTRCPFWNCWDRDSLLRPCQKSIIQGISFFETCQDVLFETVKNFSTVKIYWNCQNWDSQSRPCRDKSRPCRDKSRLPKHSSYFLVKMHCHCHCGWIAYFPIKTHDKHSSCTFLSTISHFVGFKSKIDWSEFVLASFANGDGNTSVLSCQDFQQKIEIIFLPKTLSSVMSRTSGRNEREKYTSKNSIQTITAFCCF